MTTLAVHGLVELQKRSDLTAQEIMGAQKDVVRAIGNLMRNEERANATSQRVKRGVRVSVRTAGGVVSARVYQGSKLAHFFEGGTRAHTIRAKKAKYLFFAGRGVKQVNHPGMRPRPFVAPALATVRPQVEPITLTAVEAAISKMRSV